jgi:hypothetical protein
VIPQPISPYRIIEKLSCGMGIDLKTIEVFRRVKAMEGE